MKDQTKVKKEQDLGSDNIGKLMFTLAVPAITAQLVNMLYNIVDRIYIGHIPEIGSAALTGVGICFPIIMLIMAFSSLVAMGGAPQAAIAMGQQNNEKAERILGNCFTSLLIVAAAYGGVPRLRRANPEGFRGQRQHCGLCQRLSSDIRDRHSVCPDRTGNEHVYHHPGLRQDKYAHRSYRCGAEHSPGSCVHLCVQHGRAGRGFSDHYISGGFGRMGAEIPNRKEDDPAHKKARHENKSKDHAAGAGPGRVSLYHAEYRKPFERCAEHISAKIRRGHRCGSLYCYRQRYADN